MKVRHTWGDDGNIRLSCRRWRFSAEVNQSWPSVYFKHQKPALTLHHRTAEMCPEIIQLTSVLLYVWSEQPPASVKDRTNLLQLHTDVSEWIFHVCSEQCWRYSVWTCVVLSTFSDKKYKNLWLLWKYKMIFLHNFKSIFNYQHKVQEELTKTESVEVWSVHCCWISHGRTPLYTHKWTGLMLFLVYIFQSISVVYDLHGVQDGFGSIWKMISSHKELWQLTLSSNHFA